MFDFEKKILKLQGVEAPLINLGVEFHTPWGLIADLDEAIEKCKTLDMDPTLLINPVVVLYDSAGRSEIFLRTK